MITFFKELKKGGVIIDLETRAPPSSNDGRAENIWRLRVINQAVKCGWVAKMIFKYIIMKGSNGRHIKSIIPLHTYIFIYELQSQKGSKLFHIFKGAEMKLTSNFEHLF